MRKCVDLGPLCLTIWSVVEMLEEIDHMPSYSSIVWEHQELEWPAAGEPGYKNEG